MSDPTIKGISFSEPSLDGSSLRIAIVHARWNKPVIDALLQGAISKLKAVKVKESNIVVQSVPGSYELPIAVSKYVKNLSGCCLESKIKVLISFCFLDKGSLRAQEFKREQQQEISSVASASVLLSPHAQPHPLLPPLPPRRQTLTRRR